MHLARAATGAALVLALLTSCVPGGDSPSGVVGEAADPSAARAGTAALREALLTPAHLGTGFVAVPDEEGDDEEDSDLGCLLTAFEELTGEQDDEDDDGSDIEGSWAPKAEPQLPYVGQVIVPVDADKAREGIRTMAESFDDCTEVDTTDDDGARLQLDVRTDTEASDGADEQVNVVAAGTMTMSGLELPFLFEIRLAAVEDTFVGIFMGNIGEPNGAGEAVMDTAVGRLVAVLAGDEPAGPEGLLEDELPDLGVPGMGPEDV